MKIPWYVKNQQLIAGLVFLVLATISFYGHSFELKFIFSVFAVLFLGSYLGSRMSS